MELVIGGYAQGKRRFAEEELRLRSSDFVDGARCTAEEALLARGIDRLHLLIRRLLEGGDGAEDFITRLLAENQKAVVIADEVGCGIVPLEAFEREYRDAVGRACRKIAAQADAVYRVHCGIAQRIK